MSKHYLVCGGRGFIGINLCRRLIQLGYQVTVIDNLYCSSPNPLPREVSFIQADIRSLGWDSDCLPTHLDGIFNLACPASPKNYQRDPVYTLMSCVEGVRSLLHLSQVRNIPLLQASTSEVYGDPLQSPQTEEYQGNVQCTGVRACYDEGKRAAECLCMDYYRRHNTKVRVVRIFNTYGPYMDLEDGRLTPNFMKQMLEGNPFTIYGDGSQTRSLCYIDDIVQGLIQSIASDYPGPINLGNPDERTVLEIANTLNYLLNRNIDHEFLPLPEDDPRRRCPDITKAQKLLDWSPTITLEEGLSKTVSHYKKHSIHIGIMGGGYVGTATSLFQCTQVRVTVYDIIPERCKPGKTSVVDLSKCDMVFVCVPTPEAADHSCDTTLVKNAVKSLQSLDHCPPIVVRSTVPPGTCQELGVGFMPEFLREATWEEDFRNTPEWYLGVDCDVNLQSLTYKLLSYSHRYERIASPRCIAVSTKEAEMMKYARNTFLAVKVSFCNEIALLCDQLDIDYETVRKAMGDDYRIGHSHTLVPGPDGFLGFGGNCLPKDAQALVALFRQHNIVGSTVEGALATNNRLRTFSA